MKKVLSMSVLSALLFVACSTQEPVNDDAAMDDQASDVAATEEVANGPVPYSQVEDWILDAMYNKTSNPEGYMAVQFTAGTGSCVDMGFPAAFSYKIDQDLGYAIVESEDGAMRDELVSMSDTGNLSLVDEGFTLEGVEGDVICDGKITKGSDEGTITCSVDAETVCDATYTMFAGK